MYGLFPPESAAQFRESGDDGVSRRFWRSRPARDRVDFDFVVDAYLALGAELVGVVVEILLGESVDEPEPVRCRFDDLALHDDVGIRLVKGTERQRNTWVLLDVAWLDSSFSGRKEDYVPAPSNPHNGYLWGAVRVDCGYVNKNLLVECFFDVFGNLHEGNVAGRSSLPYALYLAVPAEIDLPAREWHSCQEGVDHGLCLVDTNYIGSSVGTFRVPYRQRCIVDVLRLERQGVLAK